MLRRRDRDAPSNPNPLFIYVFFVLVTLPFHTFSTSSPPIFVFNSHHILVKILNTDCFNRCDEFFYNHYHVSFNVFSTRTQHELYIIRQNSISRKFTTMTKPTPQKGEGLLKMLNLKDFQHQPFGLIGGLVGLQLQQWQRKSIVSTA